MFFEGWDVVVEMKQTLHKNLHLSTETVHAHSCVIHIEIKRYLGGKRHANTALAAKTGDLSHMLMVLIPTPSKGSSVLVWQTEVALGGDQAGSVS